MEAQPVAGDCYGLGQVWDIVAIACQRRENGEAEEFRETAGRKKPFDERSTRAA